MLAVSLVIGSFVTVMFFIIGLLVGWVAREYLMKQQEESTKHAYHPEFYNEEGEFIDQEIVSVKFEPGYFDDLELEEDDDED